MAYSAIAVANGLIRLAKLHGVPDLTPMKLQRFLFLSQAQHLKRFCEPLLDDFFVKWSTGPVVPSIFHKFKAFGEGPIAKEASTLSANKGVVHLPHVPVEDQSAWSTMSQVVATYWLRDGSELSGLSCKQGGCWHEASEGAVIANAALSADPTLLVLS